MSHFNFIGDDPKLCLICVTTCSCDKRTGKSQGSFNFLCVSNTTMVSRYYKGACLVQWLRSASGLGILPPTNNSLRTSTMLIYAESHSAGSGVTKSLLQLLTHLVSVICQNDALQGLFSECSREVQREEKQILKGQLKFNLKRLISPQFRHLEMAAEKREFSVKSHFCVQLYFDAEWKCLDPVCFFYSFAS